MWSKGVLDLKNILLLAGLMLSNSRSGKPRVLAPISGHLFVICRTRGFRVWKGRMKGRKRLRSEEKGLDNGIVGME